MQLKREEQNERQCETIWPQSISCRKPINHYKMFTVATSKLTATDFKFVLFFLLGKELFVKSKDIWYLKYEKE